MAKTVSERLKTVDGKLDKLSGEMEDTNVMVKELYVDLSRLLENL